MFVSIVSIDFYHALLHKFIICFFLILQKEVNVGSGVFANQSFLCSLVTDYKKNNKKTTKKQGNGQATVKGANPFNHSERNVCEGGREPKAYSSKYT